MRVERLGRSAGWLTAAVFVAIAAIHAYWTAGGNWAASDEVTTAESVPKLIIGVVTVLFLAAALVVLGNIGVWGRRVPGWIFRSGTWFMAALFALRGLRPYALELSQDVADVGFHHWDLRLFGPMSLVLAFLCAITTLAPARHPGRRGGLPSAGRGRNEWPRV